MITPIRRAALPVISLLGFVLAGSQTGAAPEFSDWSRPENLGPTVNSSFSETGPALSKDGRSLYFGSNRPGSRGIDLWVSTRESVDAPWGAPKNLGAIVNSAATDNVPVLSRDEHWLFFNSTRSGGAGGLDLWASWRKHTHDNFGWTEPINLGAPANSGFNDHGPGYFENDDGGAPLLFFNSDRPGGQGDDDIYVSSQLPDGSFGPPTLLTELNSPATDNRASVRSDGLELFLFSDRLGSIPRAGLPTLPDLWVSTRETVSQVWSTPTNQGPLVNVNTAAGEAQPHIGADKESLYFVSNRTGNQDLYVSKRTKRSKP